MEVATMQLPKEALAFLTIFATVGSGMIGGLLFAFSNFVMRALAQQAPESGIRSMQAINITIINPLFFLVFLGTALASVILAITALPRLSSPGAVFLLIGCLSYLVGTFGVTMAFNVPLNDKLAALEPSTAQAAEFWGEYVASWMLWNHVRTIASILASVLLILSIRS
jgi:uncharacterized membrane protein